MPQAEIRQEQHFWSAVALLAFAALCAICFWLIAQYGTFDPASLGALDVALMGLASFRVLHLITYDKIFDMVRAAFMDEHGTRLKKAERGWRRIVCEFLQCLWCTGMWSGLIVVTIYCLGTWGRLTALVLAVAGLASLLQLIAKAVAAQD